MEGEASKSGDLTSSNGTSLQQVSAGVVQKGKASVTEDSGSSMSVDTSMSSLAASSSSTDSGRGTASGSSVTNGSNAAAEAVTAGSVCASDVGSGAVGEQFIQLAKSAKGAAAVHLIKEALEAPGLYVFAQLLHMPNIKELSSMPEHAAYYRLVEVFAYGVYDDYLASTSSLPALSQPMLTKLRHLTIVTMANTDKSLQLDTLVKRLGLNSRRELEDLIIEAIYADVLHGKLDQRNSVLEVDYALGRDIKPEDLPFIASTLKAWCDSCNGLLGTLESLVTSANKDKEASIRRENNIESEMNKVKHNFRRQPGGGGGGDAAGDDSVSQTDGLRECGDKKHRAKKAASSGQPGTSAMAKPTTKFWPKS